MKEFRNKVAVVTGAASGIGRAMAERFAREGMRVVLADIEKEPLEAAAHQISTLGADTLAVVTDVSSAYSVEALAHATLGRFGGVHIVCNNAGVGSPPGPIWERTIADWEWVLGANLWGVIHGIRVFVPLLLRQGGEGHIVNTASMAGLLSSPYLGIYNATKHAVVTMSETLFAELALAKSAVKVSVLCPGFVKTGIGESERNRAEQTDSPSSNPAITEGIRHLIAAGIPPEQVAERVFEAVRDEQLYILTHPEFKPTIRAWYESVAAERNPNPADQARTFAEAV